jgi:ADP-ribosylation factor-like protein 6
MFDMSGDGRYRSLWEQQYKNVTGIIYVVDGADPLRLCVVRNELEALLAHPDIVQSAAPIIFFCNKSDLVQSLSCAEVSQQLELGRITDRPWHIVQSNAIDGMGLDEGMSWLSERLP